jgi:hypothetical protein
VSGRGLTLDILHDTRFLESCDWLILLTVYVLPWRLVKILTINLFLAPLMGRIVIERTIIIHINQRQPHQTFLRVPCATSVSMSTCPQYPPYIPRYMPTEPSSAPGAASYHHAESCNVCNTELQLLPDNKARSELGQLPEVCAGADCRHLASIHIK